MAVQIYSNPFGPSAADIGTEIQEGEIMPVEIPVPEREVEPIPERELEEVEP